MKKNNNLIIYRKVVVVNLDPGLLISFFLYLFIYKIMLANENIPYECEIDIRYFINMNEIMNKSSLFFSKEKTSKQYLGPNGGIKKKFVLLKIYHILYLLLLALLYSIEMLEKKLDSWFKEKIGNFSKQGLYKILLLFQ